MLNYFKTKFFENKQWGDEANKTWDHLLIQKKKKKSGLQFLVENIKRRKMLKSQWNLLK